MTKSEVTDSTTKKNKRRKLDSQQSGKREIEEDEQDSNLDDSREDDKRGGEKSLKRGKRKTNAESQAKDKITQPKDKESKTKPNSESEPKEKERKAYDETRAKDKVKQPKEKDGKIKPSSESEPKTKDKKTNEKEEKDKITRPKDKDGKRNPSPESESKAKVTKTNDETRAKEKVKRPEEKEGKIKGSESEFKLKEKKDKTEKADEISDRRSKKKEDKDRLISGPERKDNEKRPEDANLVKEKREAKRMDETGLQRKDDKGRNTKERTDDSERYLKLFKSEADRESSKSQMKKPDKKYRQEREGKFNICLHQVKRDAEKRSVSLIQIPSPKTPYEHRPRANTEMLTKQKESRKDDERRREKEEKPTIEQQIKQHMENSPEEIQKPSKNDVETMKTGWRVVQEGPTIKEGGERGILIMSLMKTRVIQKTKCLMANIRALHTKSSILECQMEKVKNIGILAHIDAGKTTTTERMLFYSGLLDHIGEVDKGDTVMDYMEQERARGITIVSAAITFPWLNHRINLIDTPGHVDFTIEVERALCILDGGICILDAAAGVEAQTLTVWSQANRYHVPCIFYLNKMDKPVADVKMCLNSIEKKLRANPLQLQIPVVQSGLFNGCVDLVNQEVLTWKKNVDPSGRNYDITPLTEQIHGVLFENAMQKRNDLIESLCDIDDVLANSVIEKAKIEDVSATELDEALKRVTLARTGVPLLCGSSYKNIGVQPLLNAVSKYLPNPVERGRDFSKIFEDHMCAMAFKIIHDKHKGPLTYFRVFSGELKNNQRAYNLTRDTTAKVMKVMVPFADEHVEVAHVSNGNIALVSGLKGVTTGDILTSSQSVYNYAQKNLQNKMEFFIGPRVPDPVFFSSVEASSLSEQKTLEQALECIKLEDPTLKVKYDPETGQTVLGGMGELHLEIIKDRLEKEYKCHVQLGPMQVAYREYILNAGRKKFEYNKVIGSTKVRVVIELSITPMDYVGEKNDIAIVKDKDNLDNITRLTPSAIAAIKDGVELALSMGPSSGSPLSGVKVGIHWFEASSRTSEIAISAAASQCITQLLQEVGTGLLEPVMTLELVLDDQYSHGVVGDLSKRRATDLEFSQRLDSKVIRAAVPLAELRGYSTIIRTLTSGTANFSMELAEYRLVPEERVSRVMKEITGITY